MSLAIEENAIKMPVIALRGLVIFPEMLISFDGAGRNRLRRSNTQWSTTDLFSP
ncbi:MAG: hypothetical protein ACLR56_01725 [Oscillospiraceae bacterium]